MSSYDPNQFTAEIVDDFFQDFNDAYDNCERTLLALEQDPTNQELTSSLFRSVHTIKGNLGFMQFSTIIPILQNTEDVLEELRSNRLTYDDLLSDVVLLAMDITKALVNENLYDQDAGISQERIDHICQAIGQITQASPEQRAQVTHDAILVLDPDTSSPAPLDTSTSESKITADVSPQAAQGEQADIDFHQELSTLGVTLGQDMEFFLNLIPALESRSPYWQGRTRRIALMSLKMNIYAGKPVDPTQLAAAVCMHDISMSFLSLDVLHKQERYNSKERRQVNSHVKLSHDLLHKMENWEDSAEMVLQHHEHSNGAGYPKGVSEIEICDGAKILAIADTFDACCHSRAHLPELKRPMVRAILEVNRYAGSQFSQHWVEIFNQVVKRDIRRK